MSTSWLPLSANGSRPLSTGPREVGRRSLWLQQALADEAFPRPNEALRGDAVADVCIAGGGYTGLWTALCLKEVNPDLDVAILEADICGGGASGRNGGFVMSWWVKYGALEPICGPEDALWLCRESEAAVTEIGDFCERHGIPSDFHHGGWLWTATSQAQQDTWQDTVAQLEAVGAGHVIQRLARPEVRDRTGSRAYLGGVLDHTIATVHPGRLARGLRRVALERGVRIYERSPVIGINGGSQPIARTPEGRVHADALVVALNAWALGMAEFAALRRDVIPLSSDMIATEPIADRLNDMGWTGGEAITDSRLLVHYLQRTSDGRVALGRGGGALGFGGRFGEDFHYDRRRSDDLERSLHWLYPALADVQVTHAWGGPVDRSMTGLPFFGRLPGRERVIYGLGFSGNGVGPSLLAGRILADLASERRTRWSNNGLTSGPPEGLRFPPEPIRFLGGRLVRAAVDRKETLEDQGRQPGSVVKALAGLAPGGLFKVGEPNGGSAEAHQTPDVRQTQ